MTELFLQAAANIRHSNNDFTTILMHLESHDYTKADVLIFNALKTCDSIEQRFALQMLHLLCITRDDNATKQSLDLAYDIPREV